MADKQKDKDKTMLDFFSGSNPNRKKVQEIIKKRQKKDKKKKRRSYGVSKKLGM